MGVFELWSVSYSIGRNVAPSRKEADHGHHAPGMHRARLSSRRLVADIGVRLVCSQGRGDAGCHRADVAVHEDAPARYGRGRARPSYVHAGVCRTVVPSHGVPKGVLDDDGCVVPDAQLQIQDAVA